ncbi:MAG: class I tRNA ligase family protein [Dehalococcoidia bacterium]
MCAGSRRATLCISVARVCSILLRRRPPLPRAPGDRGAIQNITDIDDDMIRVSAARHRPRAHRPQPGRLPARDGCAQRPTSEAFPLVSETIPAIIEMVRTLLAGGHAYVVDGYVFFDTSRTPRFGALAGLDRDGLRDFQSDSMPAEPAHLKRDPLDFLLWQPSSAEGATFDSPWGAGRPGWHIECSAMAQAALGPRIDIHGGGSDLAYPHHDSEIVQSEAASGMAPFCTSWMHVGTVQLDHVKMSKSLGNLVKVSDVLSEGHSPDAVRLYLLSQHYRAPLNYEHADMHAWDDRAALLQRALHSQGGPRDDLRIQHFRNQFQEALDDDFDTPRAIRALLDIAIGLEARQFWGETAVPTLIELAGVLGLTLGREG